MIAEQTWIVATLSKETEVTHTDIAVVAEIALPSGCQIPSNLQPLMDLGNAVTELLFVGGILLGVAGMMVSGAYFILPGQDYNRKAKIVFKNVGLGVVIILSSQAIIEFLLTKLAPTICT